MNLVGNITATHNYRKGGISGPAEWLGVGRAMRLNGGVRLINAWSGMAAGLWLYGSAGSIGIEARKEKS